VQRVLGPVVAPELHLLRHGIWIYGEQAVHLYTSFLKLDIVLKSGISLFIIHIT
jgi:hypothetical protein